jgi:flagellar L-ring protein precursor FlgH
MRFLALLLCVLLGLPLAAKTKQESKESALDTYIREAQQRGATPPPRATGSLWDSSSPFADMARDSRARNIDDMVTIEVSESASAVVKGDVKTSRSSSVNASVTNFAKVLPSAGKLANLAKASSDQSLDGSGTTSRSTAVSTTLAARVAAVLPNGYLVIEGTKEVQLNSERQVVTVRGVARPVDISAGNSILSDRLAQLEVRVNGKGVVADSIRRPFFLYRLLLGLLPF